MKMIDTVSIIGLGKLGLCTAACIADAGFSVLGVDNNSNLIDCLRNGKTPFFETGLGELLKQNESNIVFTSSFEKAVLTSDISFIIVPTPSASNGSFSNEYLHQVFNSIAPVIANKEYHLINIVSTVMPGSCADEFIPVLEEKIGRKINNGWGLTYNPEFIAIGSVINDFLDPDLILIGESDNYAGDILESIYKKVCINNPRMCRSNLINAEIAKLSINCFATMKISFANNLGSLCDNLHLADAGDITRIIGYDSRIGHKFLKPGLGFGGPCFPRDNEAFIQFAEENSGYSGLNRAVTEINNQQIKRVTDKILTATKKYGNEVALLGLAYKPSTYLTEESQALEIVKLLSQENRLSLRVFDPLAKAEGNWTVAQSIDECVRDADVVVILTPCKEFKESDWEHLPKEKHKIINFWE